MDIPVEGSKQSSVALLSRARRAFAHPMMQAALAIGIAGLGRIALNTFVSVRFGTAVFAEYAAGVSVVILIGALAAAGPAAATTLGVARRWADQSGVLPTGLLRFLLGMTALFYALGAAAGLVSTPVRGAVPVWLWVLGVAAYVTYQVGRALGYAVQRATAVTTSEMVGALVPLAAAVTFSLTNPPQPLVPLLVIYFTGPAIYLVCFSMLLQHGVHVRPGALSAVERRAATREGVVFFVGAGSSMAMQYLPVILAGRMHATTTAAVLFGAVQATAPLLLLSRVYGAVMMPAFAGDADERNARAHLDLVRPLFLPSLAVALGLAPLVAMSLGLPPEGEALSVAALVAVITLMQVWSTPAVTVLSARRRELVPALASLAGLGVAALFWMWGLDTGNAQWLPVGLAVGAVVRSLVPMWVIGGWQLGRLEGKTLGNLVGAVGIAAVVVAVGRTRSLIAVSGGVCLVIAGMLLGYARWSRVWSAGADSAR